MLNSKKKFALSLCALSLMSASYTATAKLESSILDQRSQLVTNLSSDMVNALEVRRKVNESPSLNNVAENMFCSAVYKAYGEKGASEVFKVQALSTALPSNYSKVYSYVDNMIAAMMVNFQNSTKEEKAKDKQKCDVFLMALEYTNDKVIERTK